MVLKRSSLSNGFTAETFQHQSLSVVLKRALLLLQFFPLFYLFIYLLTYFYSPSIEMGTAASPEESETFLSFHELSELMQALPGFLMLLTGEGKLLYLSDSVSEHLGHSMVS